MAPARLSAPRDRPGSPHRLALCFARLSAPPPGSSAQRSAPRSALARTPARLSAPCGSLPRAVQYPGSLCPARLSAPTGSLPSPTIGTHALPKCMHIRHAQPAPLHNQLVPPPARSTTGKLCHLPAQPVNHRLTPSPAPPFRRTSCQRRRGPPTHKRLYRWPAVIRSRCSCREAACTCTVPVASCGRHRPRRWCRCPSCRAPPTHPIRQAAERGNLP